MADMINQPKSVYDYSRLNFNSRTWAALSDGFIEKLEALRTQNDSLRVTPEKTIEIRAKIAVYKELLGLKK